jgi:hypothetical protein
MLMYLVALSFIIIHIKIDELVNYTVHLHLEKSEIAWMRLILPYLFYP